MIKLDCPHCKKPVRQIHYSKSFIFSSGVRYNGAWSWIFDCCGYSIFDEDVVFESRDVGGSRLESSLRDKDDNVILSWYDDMREIQDA